MLTTLGEGDVLTVALGSERVQAVQFNTVEIGPYSLTTEIRSGETYGEAHERLMLVLLEMREVDRTALIDQHIKDIRFAADRARSQSGSRR